MGRRVFKKKTAPVKRANKQEPILLLSSWQKQLIENIKTTERNFKRIIVRLRSLNING